MFPALSVPFLPRLMRAAALALALASFPAFPASAWEARLERAADGDSFTARRTDGKRETIRLYGIDAPERGQPWARASGRNLVRLLENRALDIRPMYRDPYGRVVAVVWLKEDPAGERGSLSVNERQIADGMAWLYDYFCRENFCGDWRRLEDAARAEKRGLWREKSPVPPWKWKHAHPQKKWRKK